MTSTDLKPIQDTIEYLKSTGAGTHADQLQQIYETLLQEKSSASNRSNNYNKNNKEYHRLINNVSRARVAGNTKLYNKWCAKLEEWKQQNRPQD